jgi:N-acetylmuramoyl-L-alanine amidase
MKKAFFLTLFLFLLSADSIIASPVSVKGIRYSTYKFHTRVVIDLDGQAVFNSNRLKDPERLYFDLRNCTLSKAIRPQTEVNNGTIRKIRTGQFREDTVRVTLDLEGVSKYSAFVLKSPDRLVVDVYKPKKRSPSKKTQKKEPPVHKARNKPLSEAEFNKVKTVVIDPGHGGKDPGAIGQNGLREKDVVLSVGKRLGEILKQRYGFNVIYTRQTDIFIPLDERTEIANSKGADLFISIHANASRRKAAKGIETYFLNWSNDDDALRVAARENNTSIARMKVLRGGLSGILNDLARTNKRDESIRLAQRVQTSMVNTIKRKYRGTTDLGVKNALFYVLVGAEMPSALVEISFISNRYEERLLKSRSYREKISEGIAKGVDAYFKESSIMVRKFND